jgi:AraC-like DNA-binding protein/mannose-6-phosphate isomerase-like protein (cupin superfamily)
LEAGVLDQLERYTADELDVPASHVMVLRQHLHRVDVHWHDFYELVLVLGGTARHVVNGESYPIGPGDAFLLTPADFHEIVVPPGAVLDCYNVVIEPAGLEGRLQDLMPHDTGRQVWTATAFHEAEADFHRLWRESRSALPGRAALLQALLQCILVEFARRCGGDGPDPARDPERGGDSGVRRAVLFVDRHFREPLALADVAAQAHLSVNYFSERFREVTGSSFQSYLQLRRLRFARSLLASSELGVTEVCHASGFNSLSYFGRAFRRCYGQSPSAFRDAPRS